MSMIPWYARTSRTLEFPHPWGVMTAKCALLDFALVNSNGGIWQMDFCVSCHFLDANIRKRFFGLLRSSVLSKKKDW
eukprot:s490_g25.t1